MKIFIFKEKKNAIFLIKKIKQLKRWKGNFQEKSFKLENIANCWQFLDVDKF